MRRPCANCPWRVDAPREHWDPQHFKDIWQSCQDDGTNVMACHKSRPGAEIVCQGWVRVMGFAAIGVRLAVMQGQATVEEVEDKRGPRLFRTFLAMMRANRVKASPRNKYKPTLRRRR